MNAFARWFAPKRNVGLLILRIIIMLLIPYAYLWLCGLIFDKWLHLYNMTVFIFVSLMALWLIAIVLSVISIVLFVKYRKHPEKFVAPAKEEKPKKAKKEKKAAEEALQEVVLPDIDPETPDLSPEDIFAAEPEQVVITDSPVEDIVAETAEDAAEQEEN